MPTFNYKARDKAGKLVQGVMGAESESSVAKKLQEMGYTPVSINLSKSKPKKWSSFFDKFKRVGYADLNMFTHQLYTLQKAGLPILSSLKC